MPRRTPPPPPPPPPPPQPPQAPPPQQEPTTLPPPSSAVGVREVSFHTAKEVFSLVSLPDHRRGGAAAEWLVQGELEWILYHHAHTTGAMYRLIKRAQEAFELYDDETLVLRSSSVGKGMITAAEWAVVAEVMLVASVASHSDRALSSEAPDRRSSDSPCAPGGGGAKLIYHTLSRNNFSNSAGDGNLIDMTLPLYHLNYRRAEHMNEL